MKKRILIVAGTFAVLLLAFIIYYSVSERGLGEWGAFQPGEAPPSHGRPEPVPGAGISAHPGRDLKILQYDRQYRLRAIYEAREYEKVGERFYLKFPRVQWFLRDGQVVLIEAERGTVKATEVAGKYNLREGRLTGKVRMTIDRSISPVRTPLADRPDEVVRIFLDDVRFDNTVLTIHSDSRVSVFSREADILGRGLRMSWSEAGARQKRGSVALRELKIVHGEYMCIRQGQGRFTRDMGLPGSAGSARRPRAGDSAPAWARVPAARVRDDRPEPMAPGGPMAFLAPVLLAQMAPASGPASAPATAPTTAPTTATGPATIVPDNYIATFTGEVVATSGQQRLKDMDTLRVIFEYKRPSRDEAPATAPAPRTRPATAPTSASRPATRAATRPATGDSQPTSAPAKESEPLFITWTGPLVIRPHRAFEVPVPERFDVLASGRRVEISDEDARALCKSFEYRATGENGLLLGTDAEPVRLEMAGGDRITTRIVRFDRRAGEIHFDGAGTMHRAAGSGGQFWGVFADQSGGREAVTITWAKSAMVTIGQRTVPTDDGGEKTEDFLRSARFTGGVRTRQGDARSMEAEDLLVAFHVPRTADEKPNRIDWFQADGKVFMQDKTTGDFVRTDRLKTHMSATADGKPYPRQAVATGNVSATQEDVDIVSDTLTITFAPKADPKTGKTRTQALTLDAAGGVKVTDRRGAKTIVAEADTLRSDLLAKRATLTGKPARVSQVQDAKTKQTNRLEGAKIVLDQKRQSVRVAGAGKVRFWSDTDLSGNKAKQARPVDVAWKDSLDYSGAQSSADIRGRVRLVTGSDTLDAGRLRIFFLRPEGAETRPARTADSQDLFARQKIKLVLAHDKVVLHSTRTDAAGALLTRMELRGDEVAYSTEPATLNCYGPGTLVMEDYRPPAKKPAASGSADGAIPGGAGGPPSQSAFKWSKSMKLSQADRQARLVGDVRLAHRSGRQVVFKQRLPVAREKLPAGRNTVIDCDKMLAEFAPPPAATTAPATTRPAATAPAGLPAGLRIGPLDLFDAAGSVTLVDGLRIVDCQRIVYRRAPDIAVIYGSPPGKPVKNAVVYQKNKTTGAESVLARSRLIVWNRKTDRIEAKGVESGGGR